MKTIGFATNFYTLWEVNSKPVCYGSTDCCAFASASSVQSTWNTPFELYYEQYGSNLNNTISATVIYYSMDLNKIRIHFLQYLEFLIALY